MLKITRWVSNDFATFTVDTEDGVIVDTAPIVKRFKGQPYMNLVNWLVKKGPLTIKILKQEDVNE